MFTVNAELHPKTFLKGNLMDVFEQNESLFLSSLLGGGVLGHHFGQLIIGSLAKSHHATLGNASLWVCRALPLTGAGCLLGWCCTIQHQLILAACSFPAIQEHKIAFFFFGR